MRKNCLFGLIAFIMGMCVFVSCSSDDDDDTLNVDRAQLVGKWINTRVDWEDEEGHEYDTYDGENRFLVLNEDGTGVVVPYNLFEDEKRGTFNWNVSGNILTFVESDGDTGVYIVTKLTDNELVLRWEDYDEDICNVETTTFKRAVDTGE